MSSSTSKLSKPAEGMAVQPQKRTEQMIRNRVRRLPDGYCQIFRLYVFGPSGFGLEGLWLRYAAKFANWQPWKENDQSTTQLGENFVEGPCAFGRPGDGGKKRGRVLWELKQSDYALNE